MMAERLAEIRRDLDSEAYTSYLPKTVRELLDHIAQLEAQRGANVLATCANCAQRGHCVHAKLGEACEDHIVQRGGAVVVPRVDRFTSCPKNQVCTPHACEAGNGEWPRCPNDGEVEG